MSWHEVVAARALAERGVTARARGKVPTQLLEPQPIARQVSTPRIRAHRDRFLDAQVGRWRSSADASGPSSGERDMARTTC